jgi:hypothetical protein
MKKYALVVMGLLTIPLVAHSENARNGPVALDAVQLDAVTAGVIPAVTQTAIDAWANATGRLAMTGTRTLTTLNGRPSRAGSFNASRVSGAVSTASGDTSSDTSFSTSEETQEDSPLGLTIYRNVNVGPTSMTLYSKFRSVGITAHNFDQIWGRR